MSLASLAYSPYGSRSFSASDTMTATPDNPLDINSMIPGISTDSSPKPTKSYQPHLMPGCKADPNTGGFKYSKNGKSATGSTCEIAKLAYDTQYPAYLDDYERTKNTVKRLNSFLHKEYVFRGLVRCKNSNNRGCWREVIGRTAQEARENFCRLYGPCVGDPVVVVQVPVSYIADRDRTHVIKIGDQDVDGGVNPMTDINGPVTAIVNINAPPTPPVVSNPGEPPASAATPVATPPPPPSSTDFLNGNIGGVPTILILGGGAALLLMMMVLKK